MNDDVLTEGTVTDAPGEETPEIPMILGFGYKTGDDTRAIRICLRATAAKLNHFSGCGDEMLFGFLKELTNDVRRFIFTVGAEGVAKNWEQLRAEHEHRTKEFEELTKDVAPLAERFIID